MSNPREDLPASGDAIDKGLAEAFSVPAGQTPPSILQLLQARSPSQLGVDLGAPETDDAPVKVTDEVNQLRDPSGRYQLLGEIGRGGVGVVYKGRDSDLGRDVAMKVLKDEYGDRPDVLARFVEEAQIGGQLQHPGIVPVYELGLQAGERPYFAMKLVKGETLAAQLSRRSCAAEDRRRFLGMFEQVCQTMAYAHARRVMHRDLKPANVMIGAFGEVQIVDWGFAKVLPKGGVADEKESVQRASERSVIETVRSTPGSGSHSRAGSVMGTPAYMSPEQASGDIDHLDCRSDVFGLGAILCEILTGEPPYREADGDLLRQAANAELDGALERLGRCGADELLIALCKECLARARRARPESAGEVADRVSEYLTSVEERARQAEVRAAEARFKHRTTLLAAAASLVVLALGAGTWFWIDRQEQSRRAGAMQRVANARSAASEAHGQAKTAGLDLDLWKTARSRAEQLVSLANADDVDPATREDSREALAMILGELQLAEDQVQRNDRDRDTRRRLELLRIPVDEDVRAHDWWGRERLRLDSEYDQAFTAHLGGTSLFDLEVIAAVEALRDTDPETRLALATSLDHWSLVRVPLFDEDEVLDAARTARIREIASLLDEDDPWRSRLRELLPGVREQGEQLLELAAEAEVSEMTGASCRVLSLALLGAGASDEAVSVLSRARESHPTDFDLCFRLALFYELLEEPRWDMAVDTYRIANALRPDHLEVLHRKGQALMALERFDDAMRAFQSLSSRESENPHWLRHIGIVHAAQGEQDKALDCYQRCMSMNHDVFTEYLTLGRPLMQLGRVDDAIECYERAIDLNYEHPNGHIHLAIALEAKGELEEALDCYREAVKVAPSANTHNRLGLALAVRGKIREAIESCKEATELDDTWGGAHQNLGTFYSRIGELDKAESSFRRAAELGISSAHTSLSTTLAFQGKRQEAIEYLLETLEADPDNARLHNNLASVYQALGQFEKALDHCQKAVKLDPGLGSAYHNLAMALAELGEAQEALEAARTAVRLNPRSALAHVQLGIRLAAAGELDAAIAQYYEALKINPNDATAYVNLGNAFLQQHKPQKGLDAFLDAKRLFDRYFTDYGRRWRVRIAQEHIPEARRLLKLHLTLEEVLTGERVADSSREWADAVDLGYNKKRYREVVALAERTYEDSPELLDSEEAWGTYKSSCAATLLAGDPSSDLADSERSRLRDLAWEWLWSEVEIWESWLDTDGADEGRKRLQGALGDRDFASVRGDSLTSLPQATRETWQDLWSSIMAAIEDEE